MMMSDGLPTDKGSVEENLSLDEFIDSLPEVIKGKKKVLAKETHSEKSEVGFEDDPIAKLFT